MLNLGLSSASKILKQRIVHRRRMLSKAVPLHKLVSPGMYSFVLMSLFIGRRKYGVFSPEIANDPMHHKIRTERAP